MQSEIEKVLKKMVKKAIKFDEVPVGALIVYKNKIVAKSYNKRNLKNDVLMHAEIDVIKKTSKKLKDWRLDNCILYVTLKPCDLCIEVIKASRIKKVYYFVDNSKIINNKLNLIQLNSIFNTEYSEVLSKFFKYKR